ncbi:MAG: type II secretion system ATPase GspE [Candidatus Omnitrophica bacterium]|nr:type II secretion system ATPase GspE [Candidatus Omnitrophota bacterium]
MTDIDLLQVLTESAEFPEDKLQKAKQEHLETGDSLEDIILRHHMIEEDRLLDIKSRAAGVQWVEMPDKIAPSVVNLVPAEFALRHCILPLHQENGSLTVAAVDPSDLQIFDDLRMLTGCEIEVVLTRRKDLLENIERYFGSSIEKMIANLSTSDDETIISSSDDIADLRELAREPTVVNLVNLIIFQAVQENASDIHIEPFEKELKVRYRIDGMLQEIPPPPKHLQPAVISRIKIMSEMDIAERYTPQDGHIRLRMADRELDFRVSTIPTVHGESVVMRILDKTNVLMEISDLGFYPDTLRTFKQALHRTYGIILVTGPTGSGKTTTLYAALNVIKKPSVKIVTIEDPVEYNIEGINQMQVNPKRGLTFANGLRAIVRQDPDIIMVGEIRDFETAEIAIRSALTGHLVFSTLHTNNASGAITRLMDMGVDPYLISSSITCVLAQRLVRVNCPKCKEPYEPDAEMLRMAGFTIPPGTEVYKGAGCEHCHNQGYKGRIGIFELLPITDPIRDLILTRPSANQIHQMAGIRNLREYGWQKVMDDVTSVEEVVRVTQEDEMANMD